MKNKTSQTLVRLLSEMIKKDIKLSDAVDSDCFLENLTLDSIAILRLIMNIEKAFGIKVDSSELDLQLFSDFNKLVSFIGAKLDEKDCKPAV